MINYVDVLCLMVEFRVVNKPNCTLIIEEDACSLTLFVMQVCNELVVPNDIIRSRFCCHIFGFVRRDKNTILLSTKPVNKCCIEHEQHIYATLPICDICNIVRMSISFEQHRLGCAVEIKCEVKSAREIVKNLRYNLVVMALWTCLELCDNTDRIANIRTAEGLCV